MQVPDIGPTYDLIDRGGVIATLLVVIMFLVVGLIRQWIVTGPHFQDTKKDKEDLKIIVRDVTKGLDGIREELREQRLERRG